MTGRMKVTICGKGDGCHSMARYRPDGNNMQQVELQEKKQAILAYMEGLKHKGEKHLITGGLDIEPGIPLIAEVHDLSGKNLGLFGVEYCTEFGMHDYASAGDAVMWKEMNKLILAYAQNGGLVRILSHFPNPANARYNGLRDTPTEGDFSSILSPGTPERVRWLALIDEVIKGLLELNEHGIVPLYGPLHENNGWWFWWGQNNAGSTVLRALWEDIHARVEAAGCVVIWLWSLLADGCIYEDTYPDGLFDIVGVDVYGAENAQDLSRRQAIYHSCLAKGKPFIISEFGPYHSDGDTCDGSYDYTVLIEQVKKHWPGAVAFMSWGGGFSVAKNAKVSELMNDPYVVNQEDLLFTRLSG